MLSTCKKKVVDAMFKTKDQKGFGIVEVLLAVFVIGVLITAAWLFLGQRKKAEQVIVQPITIIENVKSSLATKYKLVDWDDGKSAPSQDGEIVYQLSNSSPAYKPDGYNFYVQDYSSGSKGIRLISKAYNPNITTPYAENIAIRQEVIKILESNSLEKIDVYTGGDDSAEPSYKLGVYRGKGLICTIQEPTSSPIAESAIYCGQLSALTEIAAQVQPIAKALPNSEGAIIMSTIKNSEISGYQYAEASVSGFGGGGSMHYLYREGEKEWVYWRGSQEMLPCKSYDTEILKLAFKGIICKDENFQNTKL